jgi:hypothetical protein
MNTLLSKQPRHGFALHQLYLTLSNGVFWDTESGIPLFYPFSVLHTLLRICNFVIFHLSD